jgi:hypothetical protein
MGAPLLLVAAAVLCPKTITPRALAANDPVEETFTTADGMQLHGLFHKSEKNPGIDPVVILLYPPGKGNSMKAPGDWEGLANRLAKEGFNVFRFDWRGHGKSTTITDTKKFWVPMTNPFTAVWNERMITGAPKAGGGGKIKNDFMFKDLKNPAEKYAPVYMLDLAAARFHLDEKNDTGDLNMSSVYLIGAEGAAGIGFGWLVTEWNRPATAPTPNQLGSNPRYDFIPQPLVGGIPSEAGKDISGAVWLSPSRLNAVDPKVVQTWIAKQATNLRENNPMLFLVGDKDPKGMTSAKFFYDEVLVAKPKIGSPLQPLDQTFLKEVKGGGTLVGAALLGQDTTLKTEDTIVKFLEAIQKNRAKIVRKNRGFANPYSIDLAAFGVFPP